VIDHVQRPKLLDLFCGAGGCSVGYHRAGFDVVGVDIEPQPRYPFEFVKAGALEFLKCLREADEIGDALGALNATGGLYLSDFAAIHASPPCQRYSKSRHCPGSVGKEYPDLLPKTLAALYAAGKPWVIENVPGASMPFPVELCGTMFGLPLRRHRLFSSSILLLAPSVECRHRDGDLTVFGHCVQVTGSRGAAYVASSGRTHYRPLRVSVEAGRKAMGCEWMSRGELSQAIPPAYTEWVGKQLFASMETNE
jgi:DNA (cytosine-5)-methyltransferase 1